MVDTREMLPDEYSHYVLRYSAIRSGFAEYNLLHYSSETRDPYLVSLFESMYMDTFNGLMEDLGKSPEDQRIRVLDYVIEQINRFEFSGNSLAVSISGSPVEKSKKFPKGKDLESIWD